MKIGYRIGGIIVVVMILVTSFGAERSPTKTIAMNVVTLTEIADTTTTNVLEIKSPVTVMMPAIRIEPPTPPTTIIPFDPVAYVNSLPYEWGNVEPAREAYHVVAASLGWTQPTISRWEAFLVDDVIRKESGGCWNLKGGGRVDPYLGCILNPQGRREDSGFFQLISVWYGPGMYLCVEHGYCGSASIIASPWASMRAGLLAVMHDGKGGWCYDAYARSYHRSCAITPRSWSND